MFSVGPRIVSGLFGYASIVELFVNLTMVFCGLWYVPFGSLRKNALIRVMISFVCRQLGPTMPMWMFGFNNA